MASPPLKSCGTTDWLRLLASPLTQIEPVLSGYIAVSSSWHFDMRTIPEHLLYFVVDSGFEAMLAGERHLISAGSILWLAPGVEHTFKLSNPSRPITLYHHRLQVRAEGAYWRPRRGITVRHNVWELRDLVAHYYDDTQVQGRWQNDRLRSLLYLLYTGMLKAPARPTPSAPGRTLSYSARRRLESYALQHAADWPPASALAAELNLSHDYFARMFRRTYGISPRSWLLRERMRLAAARLEESAVTVTDVARELGYGDLATFSRQFRQVLGVSPRGYRARH